MTKNIAELRTDTGTFPDGFRALGLGRSLDVGLGDVWGNIRTMGKRTETTIVY